MGACSYCRLPLLSIDPYLPNVPRVLVSNCAFVRHQAEHDSIFLLDFFAILEHKQKQLCSQMT